MPTKCPACSQPGTERSNPQGEARDGELVSRNASELDSASLNDIVGMAKLPGELKPAIIGEETLTCNRWIPRGDWRQRARKEKSRNLGGPYRPLALWESDGFIVAKKWGNAHGAKGSCCKREIIYGNRTAWITPTTGFFYSASMKSKSERWIVYRRAGCGYRG